ncbi:hypothetical protein [Streptomyces qaidamensis]|nr:hypothetical protein [Streptomyces qaidamensis]
MSARAAHEEQRKQGVSSTSTPETHVEDVSLLDPGLVERVEV